MILQLVTIAALVFLAGQAGYLPTRTPELPPDEAPPEDPPPSGSSAPSLPSGSSAPPPPSGSSAPPPPSGSSAPPPPSGSSAPPPPSGSSAPPSPSGSSAPPAPLSSTAPPPPSAPWDSRAAEVLAPALAEDVTALGGYYDRALCRAFQAAAGLRGADGQPTGLYSGREVGALAAFGVGAPPPAIHAPRAPIFYRAPEGG
jgi:hypothetical protein